jgi:PAS domain-containing protein
MQIDRLLADIVGNGSFSGNGDKISRLEDEFSSLLESPYNGIIPADDETVLSVTAGFGRITGITPSLLVGKRIADLDIESHL